MEPSSNYSLEIKDPENLREISLNITPDETSLWNEQNLSFHVFIPSNYPYKPPKIKAVTFIYHPNIDEKGTLCLSMIREDWSPTYTLQDIFEGLTTLFYCPSGVDPLNQEASQDLAKGKEYFEKKLLSIKKTDN